MSSYRFCRSDDIGLLVDALNRCRAPHVPGEPPATTASFKRSIRDLQVWCSSCMVAFSSGDPIGVLIGAKRPWGTLVHTIAVHPDHLRQGHGRHLLTSLSSKLAILGPPHIYAEVPDTLAAACALFEACGFAQDGPLTDYALQGGPHDSLQPGEPPPRLMDDGGRFVIPVTVDDLVANGLLDDPPSPAASAGQAPSPAASAGQAPSPEAAGSAHPQVCWERSVETLRARKDEIQGLAVASDERIEAYLLYVRGDVDAAKIVSIGASGEDAGPYLRQLIARLQAQGHGTFRLPKVHPAEVSHDLLEALGFRPAGGYRRYTAKARAA